MAQTNQTTPSLADALSPENIANPYPLYRQMREIDPVYWDERVNSWVLTTYAHNVSALRDTRFSATGFMAETAWIPEELRATLEPPIRALTRQMLFLDPPDHTRLRGLVAKAFTPRMIEALRPTIQQIADELLDTAQANGRTELIREFAYPLPAIVIATMLGVPPGDRYQLNTSSGHFVTHLDVINSTIEALFRPIPGFA